MRKLICYTYEIIRLQSQIWDLAHSLRKKLLRHGGKNDKAFGIIPKMRDDWRRRK